MAHLIEYSIDVNDVFSELNPSLTGLGRLGRLGGLGRPRCAPAHWRDEDQLVTLAQRVALLHVLLVDGKGMRLRQVKESRVSV